MRGGMGGQPLVYCKSHVVDILVAQVEARRVQVRGQGSATGTGMTFVDKINIFLSDLPVWLPPPVLVDASGSRRAPESYMRIDGVTKPKR